MSAFRRFARIVPAALLLLATVSCTTVRQPPVDAPSIVASHEPGFIGDTWEIRIGADGRSEVVELTATGTRSEPGPTLSKAQLASIEKVLTNVAFSRLETSYRGSATDEPTITLQVDLAGTPKLVEVCGPQAIEGNADVASFLTAWRLVVAFVPPPRARAGLYDFMPYRYVE